MQNFHMAAVSCPMELFSPGGQIIASEDLYGGTVRLFDNISAKNGPEIFYTDTGDIPALAAKITSHTKAIFVETPTNQGVLSSNLR